MDTENKGTPAELAMPAMPHDGTIPAAAPTAAPETKPAVPAFKVSGVFSSHMVLQREQPIRVWGFSDTPGSQILGYFMGETVQATVGEDFRFTLRFSARMYTSTAQIMDIRDDRGHHVVFEDVLVGDVWLIGGQSNAEMTLAPCMELTPSVQFSETDNFRLFTQTQAYAYAHPEACATPSEDVINPDWQWTRPSEEASLNFSAMGWYFAEEVTRYIDIPLGMVMMAAGGAALSELLPVEVARELGYTQGANICLGGYYNSLIHPFEGIGFKAMLFFQGESESFCRDVALCYDKQLIRLVADERQRFGFRFPFYNVQLSTYKIGNESGFPHADIIRIRQFEAMRNMDNTSLTVDMDLGTPESMSEQTWPHSPRKMELGDRLAKLALAKEYGINRQSEVASPCPISAVLTEDHSQVQITFTDVSTGLIVAGNSPVDSIDREVRGFSVGNDDHHTPVRAVIDTRGSVKVDVPADLPPMSKVYYAYFPLVDDENADLRGGNNLPCPAFAMPIFG